MGRSLTSNFPIYKVRGARSSSTSPSPPLRVPPNERSDAHAPRARGRDHRSARAHPRRRLESLAQRREDSRRSGAYGGFLTGTRPWAGGASASASSRCVQPGPEARQEASVRRLRRGIPRALRSHRGTDGVAYRAYTEALLVRLGGKLDRAAMATLREAGLVDLELIRTAGELEKVRAKTNRRREERRLRRVAASLRGQLMALERRLEEIAAAQRNGHGRTLAEQLTGGRG
jgi:hypothetical protein